MGIYTNVSNYTGISSDYRDVEPFVGEHFNYHELGIIAATEVAANHNAFMKAIALNELAAFEQTGSTDVLYESINIKGILDKVKMFFKKIIEKIHKIFHTFIAKMQSWFGSNKDFAKKYEKEVIKNWSKINNDFEFKGYRFSNINMTKTEANVANKETIKQKLLDSAAGTSDSDGTFKKVTDVISDGNFTTLVNYLKGTASDHNTENNKTNRTAVTGATKEQIDNAVKTLRDKNEDYQEMMRAETLKAFNVKNIDGFTATKLDSKEFTEELFKLFRSGEDSKEDLTKDKILTSYGGSVNSMMTFIKEFDKIKSNVEKTEKNVVKTIDDVIKNLDKAENDLIKANSDSNTKPEDKLINEAIVQVSSLCQSALGFAKECDIQAFSAELQATKDACQQAKGIVVKVVGLNKKMTEESYDYSNDYSSGNGFNFLESVKLV